MCISDVLISFVPTEPDGPPVIVDARAASSRSIQISLEVPTPDVVNGIILGYHLFYSLVDKGGKVIGQEIMVDVKRDNEKTTVSLIENLEEYTWYSFTARAYTSIGHGPNTTETKLVRTFEDGTNKFYISIECGTLPSSIARKLFECLCHK